MFHRADSALLEGGVDLFVLETFSDISELEQAMKAVRELCDLPIVAQMTIQIDGSTLFGATTESLTTQLDEWGVEVIGLNCGVGPAIVLNAIEKMRPLTTRSCQRNQMPDCHAMWAADKSTCALRSTWPNTRGASPRPAPGL